MTNIAINPSTVATSPYYSAGMEIGQASTVLLVSGQVGITSDGAVLDGIEAQATQAVANLTAVLEGAGLTSRDLAKLTIYLTDPADVEPFMGAVGTTLPSPPPAITMLIVSGLAAPELRVEIEAIAAR